MIDFLKSHNKIVCIEEHVKAGLGEKIEKFSFDNQINVKFYHYHLKDDFIHFYGSHSELLEKHGIELNKNRKGYNMNKYMILGWKRSFAIHTGFHLAKKDDKK